MYKYTGDSILNATFTVLVPKPLDNRTIVNNIQELYSIPPAYAYLGMTVANIDNGNIYMLVDKSKIYEKAGWKASYESIQIIACTYQEYKTWGDNTNEHFQPIDSSIEYLHQDTYYYIYEDSLPGEEENQEYVKRSDWSDLLNTVSGKASNAALVLTNQEVARIANEYATLQFVTSGYTPLTTIASMFDLEDTESFIRTNFFTKDEIEESFVKFSDLSGDDPGEGDYIFVTAARYATDQEALQLYLLNLSEELTHFLRVGQGGELGNVVISQIKSPIVNNEQLTVNITPEGFKVGNDRFAMLSDVPPHVTITKSAYETLIENNNVDPDTYYHITEDNETYVLLSTLNNDYYTKTQAESFVSGYTFSLGVITLKIDNVISMLSNYYTSSQVDNLFVKLTDLTTTLEDYVTIAMLGEPVEGLFVFVKASDYLSDQNTLARQRTDDLLAIETNYVQKNSNASLTSLETDTIKKGANTLTIADVLKFNNKQLALDEDVPVIQVVTAAQYENLVKDPDVYYFVYNTDENLGFVTASELSNYYTSTQTDSRILLMINEHGGGGGTAPTLLSQLTEDADHRTVTDAEKTAWNAKSTFSGSYNDLTDKPTIPTQESINSKADSSIIGNLGNASEEVLAQPATYSAIENGITLTEGETYYTSNVGEGEFISNGTEVSDGTNYFELTTPAIEHQDAVPHTVKSYVDTSLGGLKLVKITESAYTALQVKDPNTLYIVIED